MGPSPSRMLLTLTLSGVGLIVAAGPAMAHDDSENDGHRGTTGRHVFVDSEAQPGAHCRYAPATTQSDVRSSVVAARLVGIVARPPKVAAIDRTDDIDHQPVGWRFIVQQQIGDGEWTDVKRSALQLARASEDRAALFGRLAVRIKALPEAYYRVITRAYWFERSLQPVGAAFHGVGFYAVRRGVIDGSCPGAMPAPTVEPLR